VFLSSFCLFLLFCVNRVWQHCRKHRVTSQIFFKLFLNTFLATDFANLCSFTATYINLAIQLSGSPLICNKVFLCHQWKKLKILGGELKAGRKWAHSASHRLNRTFVGLWIAFWRVGIKAERVRRPVIISLLLAAVTLAVYWPVAHYDHVLFDDPLFFIDNPEVQSGLTWHSVVWAMNSVVVANWHPVTSLSFVLTHELFGTSAHAEHLVNAVFHAANAALLFLVLMRMTSRLSPEATAGSTTEDMTWRCAMVAAVFALHPLRVESVSARRAGAARTSKWALLCDFSRRARTCARACAAHVAGLAGLAPLRSWYAPADPSIGYPGGFSLGNSFRIWVSASRPARICACSKAL
jgi:hypothetical protein